MALATLAMAIIAVGAVLLTKGSDDYVVRARFQDASQLVKGNDVQVAGVRIGSVKSLELSDDGGAIVKMSIEKEGFSPLREGTEAIIRLTSLSGVANRYVELHPSGADKPDIPSGGELPTASTTSTVDLDKLLDAFDQKTRTDLQDFIRGSGKTYRGRGREASRGWLYLNPQLVASSRLFQELNRDTPALENFIVSSSQLVTDIAERKDDLAGLVDKLADTTGAIGRRKTELADAIGQLPPFMRRANTTFVNLRSTLDDLRPLVRESKPVARKLRPFFAELRPLARGARPTVRDLSALVRRPGADNDLIEATRLNVPVRDQAIGPVQANGKERRGAFPETAEGMKGMNPILAFLRPYAVDLTGWFDDFGHSGIYDANGGISRVGTYINAFGQLEGVLRPIPPELRPQASQLFIAKNQRNRCPGAAEHVAEDRSNPWKPSPDFNCDPSQTLPGK